MLAAHIDNSKKRIARQLGAGFVRSSQGPAGLGESQSDFSTGTAWPAARAGRAPSPVCSPWSPLGQGGVLDDPVIRSIAERTGKTPAQVVLRWHIQRGDIVFPKSVTPDRIRENIDIFVFELSATDVEDITVLNKNERTGPDPGKFDGR
jgi:Aldo/keto reductase family